MINGHGEKKPDPEVQRICSMFHYGWVPKKEVGILERNIALYREVEYNLSLLGYELINPPHCDWYIIRLKKEFDSSSFDQFQGRNKDFNRRHMALIFILYVKLILPKKLSHVDHDADLFITFEELNLNYGEKFQTKRLNPQKLMESLLKTLKKNYFVIQTQNRFYPGPSLFMLHSDIIMDTYESILKGLVSKAEEALVEEEEEESVD